MLVEFRLKDGSSVYAFKDEPWRHPKEYDEMMPPNPSVVHSTWTAYTEYSMMDSVNSIHVTASEFIREGRLKRENKMFQEAIIKT